MSREYKARGKKVDKMIKNRLTAKNKVTGEENSISRREQDYNLITKKSDGKDLQLNRKSDIKSVRQSHKSKKSLRQSGRRQYPTEKHQDVLNNKEDKISSSPYNIAGDNNPTEATKPDQYSLEIPKHHSEVKIPQDNPQQSATLHPQTESPEQGMQKISFEPSVQSDKLHFNKFTKLHKHSVRSKRRKNTDELSNKKNSILNKTLSENKSDILVDKQSDAKKQTSNPFSDTTKNLKKPKKLHFSDGDKVSASDTPSNDKKLTQLKNNIDKYNSQLEKARGKLPSKKSVKKVRILDENKGKSSTKLQFEKEVIPKGSQKSILPAPVTFTKRRIDSITRIGAGTFNQKIYEAEDENIGTKSAHRIEQAGERAYRGGKRITHSAFTYVRDRPYKMVEKLKKKTAKADIKYNFQKAVNENPKLQSNTFSRFMQKHKIKRQYVKAAQEAKKTGQVIKKTGDITAKVTQAVINSVKRHPIAAAVLILILLIVFLFASMCTSFAGLANTGFSMVIGATYLATDENLTQAELYYTELETDYEINNSIHLTHDPFELTAFLTAVYGEFTYEDIQDVLNQIFERQTTESKTFSDVITEMMTDNQRETYELLIYSGGNRQIVGNPFDFDWRASVTSYFGYRISPITGVKQWHKAIDIAAPYGTEIHAVNSGIVTSANWDASFGNYIVIEGNDGITSKYAHCSQLIATVGQEVKQGDIIALVGSTGDSTGNHLHLELLKYDEYLNAIYFTKFN